MIDSPTTNTIIPSYTLFRKLLQIFTKIPKREHDLPKKENKLQPPAK